MATESITGISPTIAVSGVADLPPGVPAKGSVSRIGRQEAAAHRRDSVVEQAQVSREKIDKVVSELKDFAQTMQRDLNFHVDDVTGHVVIQVLEASTDKVVRQIPEEEVLALARRLDGMLEDTPKGVLIESEA